MYIYQYTLKNNCLIYLSIYHVIELIPIYSNLQQPNHHLTPSAPLPSSPHCSSSPPPRRAPKPGGILHHFLRSPYPWTLEERRGPLVPPQNPAGKLVLHVVLHCPGIGSWMKTISLSIVKLSEVRITLGISLKNLVQFKKNRCEIASLQYVKKPIETEPIETVPIFHILFFFFS